VDGKVPRRRVAAASIGGIAWSHDWLAATAARDRDRTPRRCQANAYRREEAAQGEGRSTEEEIGISDDHAQDVAKAGKKDEEE
jgi:hypothetical protein